MRKITNTEPDPDNGLSNSIFPSKNLQFKKTLENEAREDSQVQDILQIFVGSEFLDIELY